MQILIITSQIGRIENENVFVSANTLDILKRFLILGDLRLICKKDNGKASTGIDSQFKEISSKDVILLDSFKIFTTPAIRRLIDEEVSKADLVIGYVPCKYAEYGIISAKKYGKKYMAYVVSCSWDAYWNHSLKGKCVAPFAWHSLRKTLKNSDYALYVSKKFLQKRYPSNSLQCGASDVKIKELNQSVLESRINRIENMDLDKRINICTTAAIYVRYKGQQYVIEALGKLKRLGDSRFHYYLIGSGSKEYLLNVAKKNNVVDQVHFLGIIPHDKVFNELDKMDLYIQPSLQEGLPRSVVEAMSRALPCIGACTGGIPELLPEKCIVRRKSPDDIARILKATDKKFLLEMAAKNFETAKMYLDCELNKTRENFFLKVLKDMP